MNICPIPDTSFKNVFHKGGGGRQKTYSRFFDSYIKTRECFKGKQFQLDFKSNDSLNIQRHWHWPDIDAICCNGFCGSFFQISRHSAATVKICRRTLHHNILLCISVPVGSLSRKLWVSKRFGAANEEVTLLTDLNHHQIRPTRVFLQQTSSL